MSSALKDYLDAKRGRATRLAARLDIGRGYLSEIANGKKPGSVDLMKRIAVETGIPISALLADAHGPIRIPIIAWVSAGALADHGPVEDGMVIDYATGCDLAAGDWIAFRVEGSSMDRISPPDSIIFVNRRERQLVANACYVIADADGSATYKRFRPDPSRFEPVSTADHHATIFPDNTPHVVGRVRRTILDL